MLCLTLVGAFMKEESIKQKYWSHVLEPLQVSFKELVDRIPTPDKAQAGKITFVRKRDFQSCLSVRPLL